MRRDNVSSTTNKGVTPVGCKNHSWCHWRFKQGIEVRETFNIEHVNLCAKSACGFRKRPWWKWPTSSMNTTPGTTSATPWSTYPFTTLLTSLRNLSVTSVRPLLTRLPITLIISCPPCGLAFAASRSPKVTSCTNSLRLCTSPFGRGTYVSDSRSYEAA